MEPSRVSDDDWEVVYSFKSITDLFTAGNLQRFLKTRRSPRTRFYVGLLLLTLTDWKKRDKTHDGWVCTTEMRETLVADDKIPNLSTFYNLLRDLHAAALIEKRSGETDHLVPGSPPAYYRVPVIYEDMWFVLPADVLADHYVANRDALVRVTNRDSGNFDTLIPWIPHPISPFIKDEDVLWRIINIRLAIHQRYLNSASRNEDSSVTP